MSKQKPRTLAAVDLGSNSFHMVVANVVNGKLQVVDRIREMVRLAGGIDKHKYITEETMERALACLNRFGQRLGDFHPGTTRIVGTNTLRLARNSGEFIRRAEIMLGHYIEIISGREEARLIYLGVAHDTEPDDNRRLVMDIGGGSTEFIIGRQFTAEKMESLHMGCVSISNRYFSDGSISAANFRDAVLAARQELEPITESFMEKGWVSAIGASGSIRAVNTICLNLGLITDGMTLEALRKLRDILIEAGHIDKLQLDGLSGNRAPVFPGGLAILLASFKALEIEKMNCSGNALREGLLYDMLGRSEQTDIREVTIDEMCKRYLVDEYHASRIAETATLLKQQVEEAWRIQTRRYDNLLRWACRVHELGLNVAHSKYHQHGAYLLRYSDMPGFSRQEQACLGALLSGQRRKLQTEQFSQLPVLKPKRILRLCLLLRLAVVLHRSRSPDPLPAIKLEADGRKLDLWFPKGWLQQHPLTQADLEQEASYLGAAGYALTFS